MRTIIYIFALISIPLNTNAENMCSQGEFISANCLQIWHNHPNYVQSSTACPNAPQDLLSPAHYSRCYVTFKNCDTRQPHAVYVWIMPGEQYNPPAGKCPCDEEQAQQDAESTCQNSLGWQWTDQANCEWECVECNQEEARQQAERTCGDYWQWTDQNNCEWDCEPDDEDNFGDDDGDGDC
jgi:hypothetical protein